MGNGQLRQAQSLHFLVEAHERLLITILANAKLSQLKQLCRRPSDPDNRTPNPHAYLSLAVIRLRSHKLAGWLKSAIATTKAAHLEFMQ